MTWAPLHPKHSIESVGIRVLFDEKLPRKVIKKIQTNREESRLKLGFNTVEFQSLQNSEFTNSINTEPQLIGWTWKKQTSENILTETLALDEMVLIYEVRQYTNWDEFISRFLEVVNPVIEEVINNVTIVSFSLDYFDRFKYMGPLEKASAHGLFKETLQRLPEVARNGTSAWHSHVGWFEELSGHPLLINQNIDTQDTNDAENNQMRTIQIFTKTELRPEAEIDNSNFFSSNLPDMHKHSKNLVKNILDEDVCKLIGIK